MDLESQVIYNTSLDFDEGIDLLISRKGRYWGVCMFTDTARAYEGREAKKTRHRPFSNVRYVEIPVSIGGSMKVGDFYLYGREEYDKLQSSLGSDAYSVNLTCRLSFILYSPSMVFQIFA